MTPTATAVELKPCPLYINGERVISRGPKDAQYNPATAKPWRRFRVVRGRDLCRRGSRAKGFSRLEQDAGGAARQGAL